MKFNKSIIEIIKERTSRRTYDAKLLDEKSRDYIKELLLFKDIRSPFSEYVGKCRFELIAIPEFDPKEKKKLGTYGLILGAQEFIVGAIERSEYAREHFGYMMEYLILVATDMGLGTCWLGGTFNRGLFRSKINCKPDEIMPAITPIGSFPEKRRTKEKVIRKVIKAEKRFPWERLFFKDDFNNPLNQDEVKKHSILLEMVRLGPSAGNKQPWRIVKDSNKDIFHFYILKVTGRYKPFPPLDIGISVCHWDLTAEELGIKGKWKISKPNIPSEGFEYKISWIEE